mgnify:FL=1
MMIKGKAYERDVDKRFCILKLQKNAVLVLLAMCVVFTVS